LLKQQIAMINDFSGGQDTLTPILSMPLKNSPNMRNWHCAGIGNRLIKRGGFAKVNASAVSSDLLDTFYPCGYQTFDQNWRDVTANTNISQGFKPNTSSTVTKVRLWLKKTGAPTGNITISIETDTAGVPSGTSVTNGDSQNVDVTTLTTGYGWVTFTFAANPTLVAGTQYHIVLQGSFAISPTACVSWGADNYDVIYPSGSMSLYGGATWTAQTLYKACFEVYITGGLSGTIGYGTFDFSSKNMILGAFGTTLYKMDKSAVGTPDGTWDSLGAISSSRFWTFADWQSGTALINTDVGIYKYTGTGSAAIIPSVSQVYTVTLTGISGTATIAGAGGLSLTATFSSTLTTTASNFVTANAAAYAAVGITLTSSNANLIFTATLPTTIFVPPTVTNATGDLAGTVVYTTAASNVPISKFIIIWKNYCFAIALRGSPNGYQYCTLNDYTTWPAGHVFSNAFDTNDGDVVTGVALLKGKLYVFKRYSIFRITYVGSNPTFQIDQILGTGCPSHYAIKEIDFGGNVGTCLIFPTTDKKLAIFDGYNIQIINDVLTEKTNDLFASADDQPIAFSDMNYTYTDLFHAVVKKDTSEYILYCVLSTDSTVKYAFVYDWKTNGVFPYDNQIFSSSVYALSTNKQKVLYTVGYDGYMYQMESGNSDNGSAINAYYVSGKMKPQSAGLLSKTLWLLLYIKQISSGTALTINFQYRCDWNVTWTTAQAFSYDRNDQFAFGATVTFDVGTIENMFQIKLKDNSTQAASTIYGVDLFGKQLGTETEDRALS